MWNYIFYIAYLDFKDETEYNGIETYIDKKIKQKEIDWFPIGRALMIKDYK